MVRRATCATRACPTASSSTSAHASWRERPRDLRADRRGKSAVAEAIADARARRARLGRLDAGLPRPADPDEPVRRPTRLVGIWPLHHEASVAEFAGLAHAAIDEILAAGRLPIVVGGTGLYLRAALVDLQLPPPPVKGARERWSALYDERGSVAAHAELSSRDPAAAAAVHPNDRRRVVRALELAESGSSLRPETDRLWEGETRHPTAIVGLDVPRELVDGRIAERTEAMLAAGAAEEARAALAGPLSSTARKVIGLDEAATLPREQALEAIARAHAPLCGLPAEVDAADSGPRYGRRRSTGRRGGGCGSRRFIF